ncbi:MAG TPA: FAD-dependent monooxygenase [Solirubrobacteraceae bacterium]|nr:FAD-dependent monooxygenase [Solirubrobacteraceae bacterium]
MARSRQAIVVGGSLAGLSCALTIARAGVRTLVLERSPASLVDGAGLGVDLGLLARVAGDDVAAPGRLPVLHDRTRDSAAYIDVRSWLRSRALEHELIEVDEHAEVVGLEDGDGDEVTVRTANTQHRAAIVVGADGVRSITRGFVEPRRPDAEYAGYLLWRALVDEHGLSQAPAMIPPRDTMRLSSHEGYQLVAYAVPGADGSVDPGHRRLSIAWYDGGRSKLLRETKCVEGSRVLQSLTPDRIPKDVIGELQSLAGGWPRPWGEVIGRALDRGLMFGFPIAEYVPTAVANGRVAIAGDAAHVATPMTGRGFVTALEDALAIGSALAENGLVRDAMTAYERRRLEPVRSLVMSGRVWSEAFLHPDRLISR